MRPARGTDRSTSGGNPVGGVVETTVERIVPGGRGLAHAAGRTLFVDLAAPGDRVRVRIDRVQGKVGFAGIVEVLEPSPVRIPPPFPEATRCGGCDFQHLTYDAQLAAKVGIVRDCLRRIGGVNPPTEIPITPSPQRWGYRSRAEWHHDAERRVLGYFERETHRVCDPLHCPTLVPELNAALGGLRDRLVAGTLPRDVVEVRAAACDGGTSLSPSLDGGEPAELRCRVAGETYAYDAACFFQVNLGVLEPLVREALRDATDDDGRPVLDLYCGVGLFTLPLVHRCRRVIGVEAHPQSAAFAARNAAEAGLANVRIEAMPVGRWLEGGRRSFGRAPLVVVDPPRTGLDGATLAGLLRLRPARIVYVSCDPATLARDLRALLARDYRLDGVAAFDMFPQTHHVETVAHLVRAV